MAFNSLEPIGEERADLRSAIIASTVANFSGAADRTYAPKDFMPDFSAAPQRGDRKQDLYAQLRRLHDQLREG